jgi:hypothetical protein
MGQEMTHKVVIEQHDVLVAVVSHDRNLTV